MQLPRQKIQRATTGGAWRRYPPGVCVRLACGVAFLLAAMVMGRAAAASEWSLPAYDPAAPPPLGEKAAYEIRYASNQDEGEEDNEFKAYLEEVFLGFVIYPQEQGEVQLTWGYFDHVETNHDSLLFFEMEYGITDRLQIGLAVPVDFLPEESFTGVRHLGVELYWNFYSNPDTGRGYGVGFEIGLPTDAPADESRETIYEPFAVAYQDFGAFAANISGAVEVGNAWEPGEPTETSGEVAAAVFGSVGKFTPMLEIGMEIEADQTPVRLAPGLYWSPWDRPIDFAVALPIGLNRDAPDLGVYLLAIVEFDSGVSCPRLF